MTTIKSDKNFNNPEDGKNPNIYNDFFKKPNQQNSYVWNTCTSNKDFRVSEKDESPVDYLIHKNYNKNNQNIESFTTIRRGVIKRPTGIQDQIFIKMIAAHDKYSLDDVKYNVEAYSVIPKHISSIEMLNACDVIDSRYGKINPDSNIIIVGMEKLYDFKEILITYYKSNHLQFKEMIKQLLDACDNFNRYGFFHTNLKYQNIGLSSNFHTDKNMHVVLTDFTETVPIENINSGQITKKVLLAVKPPLNSFYICIYIIKQLNKIKINGNRSKLDEMTNDEFSKSRPSMDHLIKMALYYYQLIKKLLNQELTQAKDDEAMIDFLSKNQYGVSENDVKEFGIKHLHDFDIYDNINQNMINKNSQIYSNLVKDVNNKVHDVINIIDSMSYKNQLDVINKHKNKPKASDVIFPTAARKMELKQHGYNAPVNNQQVPLVKPDQPNQKANSLQNLSTEDESSKNLQKAGEILQKAKENYDVAERAAKKASVERAAAVKIATERAAAERAAAERAAAERAAAERAAAERAAAERAAAERAAAERAAADTRLVKFRSESLPVQKISHEPKKDVVKKVNKDVQQNGGIDQNIKFTENDVNEKKKINAGVEKNLINRISQSLIPKLSSIFPVREDAFNILKDGSAISTTECDCKKCTEICNKNKSSFGRKINKLRYPVSYRMSTTRRSPVSYRMPTTRRSPVYVRSPKNRRSMY